MEQGDYASYYQQPYPHLHNPNSIDHHSQTQNQTAPPYASAPPFSTSYDSPFSVYPQNYQPYPPQNSDSTPLPTSQPSFFSYDPHGPTFLHQQQQQPTSNQSQPYFSPFDHHQTAPVLPNYASPTISIPTNPSPTNPHFPSVYTSPVSQGDFYDDSLKFDGGVGGYSNSGSGLGPYGDGVYAYQGGKVEPYGETAPKSSNWAGFDDFGRPISFPDSSSVGSGLGKMVRAVPKVEAQEDVKGGVQKFRVNLLAESGGQSTMDVLCQIGLDGIRMLDPSTSRTLQIYPLETITRCDKLDSSTFVFWSKTSVDNEPRRIRLQSNSYTTSTLLDIVTAATVQLKEMGGTSRPLDLTRPAEQPTEKKKGFVDWMNMIKPGNEEKDHWVPDEAVSKCTSCGTDFNAFVRRHHCRNCGDIFCDKCTQGRIALTADVNAQPVRVCDQCMAEATQRLGNAKEAASKLVGLQNHEDLARKLQEEMAKNCRVSSGLKSDGSGRRMKEVACPTCTVHLQVQVPTSGSETIECGVCQHPFQVSAY